MKKDSSSDDRIYAELFRSRRWLFEMSSHLKPRAVAASSDSEDADWLAPPLVQTRADSLEPGEMDSHVISRIQLPHKEREAPQVHWNIEGCTKSDLFTSQITKTGFKTWVCLVKHSCRLIQEFSVAHCSVKKRKEKKTQGKILVGGQLYKLYIYHKT